MSSEIRAGDNRTYWIISNGNSLVDGVTDPGLVTTVGNGWHIYWIGSDYEEYVGACDAAGFIPRIQDPNTPSTSSTVPDKISARQIRLWLIQNGYDLSVVENAINNIEDENLRKITLIEWEYAPYVERNHPMVAAIAQALGLTSVDIDTAFINGVNI